MCCKFLCAITFKTDINFVTNDKTVHVAGRRCILIILLCIFVVNDITEIPVQKRYLSPTHRLLCEQNFNILGGGGGGGALTYIGNTLL